jgi:hypothetical protein
MQKNEPLDPSKADLGQVRQTKMSFIGDGQSLP